MNAQTHTLTYSTDDITMIVYALSELANRQYDLAVSMDDSEDKEFYRRNVNCAWRLRAKLLTGMR